MTHQVALSFEDGVTRFITCADGQTVADASYRQRVNIPLDCRDGACGTCKAFCESGEYDGGAYIDDALSADEAAAGYVLPCSMRPRSDLVLRIASTSAVAKTQASTYRGTVTGLERLSPTTVALTVETPERDELAFLPGQYVNIAVPGTDQTRSYSFSNAPDDKALTFLVKLTPGGAMSTYLTERAAVGDELTFTGPNGSFFLREAEHPVLLLAGGTGLAPMLSIVRGMRATGSTRPAHLVYGVTTDDDLVETDTLAELAAQVGGPTWDHCVADPNSAAPNKGYVTGLVRDEHLHDGEVAVYVCGPPAMVEAVRKHFADLGVEPIGFYYEKFAPSTAPAAPTVVEPVVIEPAVEPVEEHSGDTRILDPGDPMLPAVTARAIAGQEMLPAYEDVTSKPRFLSPGRFAGKVVLVTGAAQGIGERTARRISAEGGTLVLADRSDLVTDLAEELAGEVLAVTADLETWSGAAAVVDRALSRFGRIDVLVNNVGGAIRFKPFTEFTEQEIAAEISRSLMTTLWCCRAALPSMVERGSGVIVNVSSAATRGIHRIPYSAAKGGVNAITASLALEYAHAGIRVVATAPGGTDAPPRRISRGGPELVTDQERAWYQAHIDQTIDSSLLKRYGSLDEQAAAIAFLASDEASYITGTVLPVAGGDPG